MYFCAANQCILLFNWDLLSVNEYSFKSKSLIWTHTFGVGTLISDCMNKDSETVLICCISYRVQGVH